MRDDFSVPTFEHQAVRNGEVTISEMARTYGVSLRTLRFYEDRALLRPRRNGTARFYDAHQRIRLELILKGKRLGFTLAEIHELIASREKSGSSPLNASQSADLTVSLGAAQLVEQIAYLRRQRDELDAAIEELQRVYARMTGPLR